MVNNCDYFFLMRREIGINIFFLTILKQYFLLCGYSLKMYFYNFIMSVYIYLNKSYLTAI